LTIRALVKRGLEAYERERLDAAGERARAGAPRRWPSEPGCRGFRTRPRSGAPLPCHRREVRGVVSSENVGRERRQLGQCRGAPMEQIAYRIARVERCSAGPDGKHGVMEFKTPEGGALIVAIPTNQLVHVVAHASSCRKSMTKPVRAGETGSIHAFPIAKVTVGLDPGPKPGFSALVFELPDGMEIGFRLNQQQSTQIASGLLEYLKRASSGDTPTAH
jgi:hypothetical protein